MKKIAMVFMLFLITGCAVIGGNTLHFKGESESWLIKYTVVNSGDSQVASYIIDYIGEGANPESFDYVVSAAIAGNESERIGANFQSRGILEVSNISLGARVMKDEIVTAEFSWEGETESIVLELDE